MRRNAACLSILAVALVVSGCGGNKVKSDGPGSTRIPDMPGDAVPRKEARSKYGNGRNSKYEVWGKTYTVMDSSAGYQERGVASWYGKKFHGRRTSNQEVYDMYEMTAAHKSLPLPTYVRVRNLRNDRTIVVRVNDRGPFVENRIIDLSYAAALKLDMITAGTSLVEVTAINFDEPTNISAANTNATESGPTGDRPTSVKQPPSPPPRTLISVPSVTSADAAPIQSPTSTATSAAPSTTAGEHDIFVQVGAFGERKNADRRLAVLAQSGIGSAYIHEDTTTSPTLFRVRIGPIADVVQYDVLVEELGNLGIYDPYLISE